MAKSSSKGVSNRYVALLRGVNVGGKNKLPMKSLAQIFVDAGCANVRTYIQSGNVVFDAPAAVAKKAPKAVTTEISRQFGFNAPVVMRSAADTLKKVSLELGGKSPNIVFADADLKAAVRGASTGIYYGKGEVCAAGSRILVQASVYDDFVEAFAARAASMTIGDPMDSKTRVGAIVSERQLERVLGYVEAGKREGARLVCGGERATVDGRGNFVTATAFADVDPGMTIAREEIFGPVASILRFEDVEDAVRIGNETIYGLAAGVWTRDVGKAHRVARELQAGTVWVNTYNQYDSASPFGGYKSSGFGRDLGYQSALEKYTQTKSVWVAVDG